MCSLLRGLPPSSSEREPNSNSRFSLLKESVFLGLRRTLVERGLTGEWGGLSFTLCSTAVRREGTERERAFLDDAMGIWSDLFVGGGRWKPACRETYIYNRTLCTARVGKARAERHRRATPGPPALPPYLVPPSLSLHLRPKSHLTQLLLYSYNSHHTLRHHTLQAF